MMRSQKTTLSFHQLAYAVVVALLLALVGCAQPSDGDSTGTVTEEVNELAGVTVLTGSVSATSSSSSRSARGGARMESCTVSAYDMEDQKVAETQASGTDQSYNFDGADLAGGEDYKIVSDCSYNGQTGVKMSSYARTIPDKSVVPSPVEVNPKTTAIAVMIRKAIISAISAAESSLGLDLFDVKVAILSSVSSIIDDMAQTLADDPTFIYPEDPLEASATEKTISASLNLSNLTTQGLEDSKAAIDNATAGDKWDVSTAEAKIEAAEAAGKQGLACGVDKEATEKEMAVCSQVILEVFAARLNWTVIVDLADEKSHWKGKSCGEKDFVLPASKYTYLKSQDECWVVPKAKIPTKYGTEESGFQVTWKTVQAISSNMKLDTKYTLTDVNNFIFKNDNVTAGEQTGLGGWLGATIYTGKYRGSYYFGDKWVKHDNRSIDTWVYSYEGYSWKNNYNWMLNKYKGEVPTFEEVYNGINSNKYFDIYAPIESTYRAVLSERVNDSDCFDRNPRTKCLTDNGTNANDLVYQIGIEWGLDDQGKRVIKSLNKAFDAQTKSKRNYELFRWYSQNTDIGVDLFEVMVPGTGNTLRDTDDTGIAFYYVFEKDENNLLSCPALENNGVKLDCSGHESKFVQINYEYVGDGEVFETPGFSDESEVDPETQKLLEEILSENRGDVDIDNPLWNEGIDGILIEDYQGNDLTFSKVDDFMEWAIQGGSDFGLDGTDRLHRCSFWKEEKLSGFDNTSREICESSSEFRDENNDFTSEYASFTMDYHWELQDNNNDKSVLFPDFIDLSNVLFRDSAYQYTSNQEPLALIDFAFDRKTWGVGEWDEKTEFNAAQVFTFFFYSVKARDLTPLPKDGLEDYFSPKDQLGENELKAAQFRVEFPAFSKNNSGPYLLWEQFANALNHPERLR